jgi:hypothetical protein
MTTAIVFYTYAYLREDGAPYYIGKGKGHRAYRKRKGEVGQPPKDPSRILILKKNLTEEEAFKHECYMISVLGRKDVGTGMLINMTEGGQGPSGHRRTESQESRQRKSIAQKGNQNRKGIPHTEEAKEKIKAAHLALVTEETRARDRRNSTGRRHTPETRAKIAEANRKRVYSEETRLKISQARQKYEQHKRDSSLTGDGR